MIPKIIHYCWFGHNPFPDLVERCIESWKKYCPEYEIIEWNEDNFDVHSNAYVADAYAAKKWAFVSDYVRLVVLYNYGGIYLDTDMELLHNIDVFLDNKAFSGFETHNAISAGIIGCEPKNDWVGVILSSYNNRKYRLEDTTTIPQIITKITKKMSNELVLNNSFQVLDCGLTLYPIDVFYPMDYYTGEIAITDASYSIHHFASSWSSEETRNSNLERQTLISKHPRLKKYLQSSHPLVPCIKLIIDGVATLRVNGFSELVHRVAEYLSKKY